MEASSGKRQCLPQADDDDVPPTLEAARRMQQQSLLRGLEELSRREGDLTLVLDGGIELRAYVFKRWHVSLPCKMTSPWPHAGFGYFFVLFSKSLPKASRT